MCPRYWEFTTTPLIWLENAYIRPLVFGSFWETCSHFSAFYARVTFREKRSENKTVKVQTDRRTDACENSFIICRTHCYSCRTYNNRLHIMYYVALWNSLFQLSSFKNSRTFQDQQNVFPGRPRHTAHALVNLLYTASSIPLPTCLTKYTIPDVLHMEPRIYENLLSFSFTT